MPTTRLASLAMLATHFGREVAGASDDHIEREGGGESAAFATAAAGLHA